MVTGRATAEGTQRYAEKLAGRLAAGHFRELAGGAAASTLASAPISGRRTARRTSSTRMRSLERSSSASTSSTRR
jgi:hypothetical protein